MPMSLKQAFAFLIVVLLGACQGEPSVTPKLEHPVGETLEGVYHVGWGSLDRMYEVGTLKLKDGLYSFTPLMPVEQIPEAADRLCFVRNTEGRYSVEYKDPVDGNTLLEDLNGFAFLALIRFATPPSATVKTPDSNNAFYLATDQEGKYLVFHSTDNELQLWSVSKPWD
jgi:hypothetical protein